MLRHNLCDNGTVSGNAYSVVPWRCCTLCDIGLSHSCVLAIGKENQLKVLLIVFDLCSPSCEEALQLLPALLFHNFTGNFQLVIEPFIGNDTV